MSWCADLLYTAPGGIGLEIFNNVYRIDDFGAAMLLLDLAAQAALEIRFLVAPELGFEPKPQGPKPCILPLDHSGNGPGRIRTNHLPRFIRALFRMSY